MQGKRGSLTKKQLATLPGHQLTIAERQLEVARHYVAGYVQAEIAARVGVSQQQVSKDIEEVKRRWREMSTITLMEHRAKALDSVDRMEQQCNEAWEKSKADAETKKVTVEKVMRLEEVNESIPVGGKKPKRNGGGVKVPEMKLVPVRECTEVSVKGQTGDVRFQQQIAWCVEMRLKILGVLEEKKGDVNILNLNWEQLESKVRQQAPDVVEERLRLEAMKTTNGG